MATVSYIAARRENLLNEIADFTGIDMQDIDYIRDPNDKEAALLEAILEWIKANSAAPAPPPEAPKKPRGRPRKQPV